MLTCFVKSEQFDHSTMYELWLDKDTNMYQWVDSTHNKVLPYLYDNEKVAHRWMAKCCEEIGAEIVWEINN